MAVASLRSEVFTITGIRNEVTEWEVSGPSEVRMTYRTVQGATQTVSARLDHRSELLPRVEQA